MMKISESRIVFTSTGVDEDEDQRRAWLGIIAREGRVDFVMSGEQCDGESCGEITARLSRSQLLKIRDFIDSEMPKCKKVV